MIKQAREAMTEAQELLTGHADAAHWGDVVSDCERCVTLAAECGVDLHRGCGYCLSGHGGPRCSYCS